MNAQQAEDIAADFRGGDRSEQNRHSDVDLMVAKFDRNYRADAEADHSTGSPEWQKSIDRMKADLIDISTSDCSGLEDVETKIIMALREAIRSWPNSGWGPELALNILAGAVVDLRILRIKQEVGQ
ncbi:MAG: hypothetical protein AAFY56_10435 [Pseudomonadota bacterium]